MFIKFVYMILLAAWCFLGFLLAFYIIGAGKFPPSEIAKFMVWVTFGMDGEPEPKVQCLQFGDMRMLTRDWAGHAAGTPISQVSARLPFFFGGSAWSRTEICVRLHGHQARHFHPYLGPFLWVAYACVSSTLLLTTTISILSNTFRHIADDAGAEVSICGLQYPSDCGGEN